MSGRSLLICAVVAIGWQCRDAIAQTPEDSFSREVAPILVKRCLECHGAQDASGKLVLVDRNSLMAGGDSGVVIVPGRPDQSLLLTRVTTGEMPPPRRGHSQKLSDAEIAVLKSWIASGAYWPAARKLDLYEATTEVRGGRDWWSFQPLKRPQIPSLPVESHSDFARNPVDVFIQQKLLTERMQPAPQADRVTLIKRISFDLLGLPPTYEDIQEFATDLSPDAVERLLDRMLASPHFGERWGRYWLDAVRYADTCGYERDQEQPHAWKYRDWVIQAINEDMRYDQFVVQQLAGDEIAVRSEASVIATGFLRLGTWNDEPNDPDEYKYERLEDMVHVTSTGFLGLTVKCARCHDHKFDPIPQVDYYRMAAAFWPGPVEPRGRELLGGPTRDELGFDVMGWTDIRQPPPLHLLRKGEPKHPLGIVEPGHLSLINSMNRPFEPAPLGSKTTHRRRQLADWISSPENPLTPRVLVNRIWMNHFGMGLVRSADNFGFTGDKPTHPELLDWLAGEMINRESRSDAPAGLSGAPHYSSLKLLHRLMVSSATYRQSSLHPQYEANLVRDSGNHWWWRAERRRLDSEPLRDRMLFVGGDLDTRMGGTGFKPTIQPEALEGLSRKEYAWKPSAPAEQQRRAVYMFSQRSLLPPLMTTFDFADTTLPCVQRSVSTVAPQALALLNNSFSHERSDALAARILRETVGVRLATSDVQDSQIRRCWQLALSRDPTAEELAASRQHLQEQRSRFDRVPGGRPVHMPSESLVLHLSAGIGVSVDGEGRIESWRDQSGHNHGALQSQPQHRPLLVRNGIHDQPVLRFDGQRRFLQLTGQVVSSQAFTLFAVVTDQSTTDGHREIFSNWNGNAGNSGSSLFLGMTGRDSVRLSDDLSGSGHVVNREQPFILSGVSGPGGASVFQNGQLLATRGQRISPRNLKTGYVIGQQGNIDGEFWHGDLAEILVFDRELSDSERRDVAVILGQRYGIGQPEERPSAARLALASLCHVLLNTNEFVYVD